MQRGGASSKKACSVVTPSPAKAPPSPRRRRAPSQSPPRGRRGRWTTRSPPLQKRSTSTSPNEIALTPARGHAARSPSLEHRSLACARRSPPRLGTRRAREPSKSHTARRQPRVLFQEPWLQPEVLDFLSLRELARLAAASRIARAASDGAARRIRDLRYDILGFSVDGPEAAVVAATSVCIERAGIALNSVRLPQFPGDCSRLLDLVGARCVDLVHLDLAGCPSVSDYAVVLVGTQCSKLEHVRLDCCHLVSDSAVASLAVGCPKLAWLSLHGCWRITDAGFAVLGRHAASLASAILCHLPLVGPIGIKALAAGCQQLSRVDMGSSDNVSFQALTAGADGKAVVLKNLVALDVRNCGRIDDGELHILASSAPKLDWLSVEACLISDAGVSLLVERCRLLTDLFVNRCMNLTDTALAAIAKLPLLRRLGIEGCEQVTDEGLRALSAHRQTLVTLGLNNLPLVSDVGVKKLVAALPDLAELFLNQTSITDHSLAALACHCPKLWHLSLNGCKYITPAGIQVLARGCGKLERLHVADCSPSIRKHKRAVSRMVTGSVAFTLSESYGYEYAAAAAANAQGGDGEGQEEGQGDGEEDDGDGGLVEMEWDETQEAFWALSQSSGAESLPPPDVLNAGFA